MKKFSRVILSAFAAGSVLSGTAALAETTQGTATVDIVTPVSVVAGDAMDFGTISRPATGSSVITLDTAGSATVGSGTAGVLADANRGAGTFTVTAEAGNTISVSVGNITNPGDASIDNFTVNYNGSDLTGVDSSAATATSVASDTVEVGADLTISSTTTAGTKSFTYDLTVDYQ